VSAPGPIAVVGAPAMMLGCLAGSPARRQPVTEWREALAPEVMLRLADAGPGAYTMPSGGVPYALLAIGTSVASAVRLTRSMLAKGDGPGHLLLFQCPDPVPLATPLACRLTVFAPAQDAGMAARWQASSKGEFALRVLRDPLAVPPFGPFSPDLALAIKEELGVWPR
jgi:hypothetical protein